MKQKLLTTLKKLIEIPSFFCLPKTFVPITPFIALSL